jgi:hypothetical protein
VTRVLLVAVALALSGCPGVEPVQPDPRPCDDCMPPMPDPAPQPTPEPEPPMPPTEDACARAAANMARLGCDGWRGSPGQDEHFGSTDDVGYAQVCRDTEASSEGRAALSAHPDCVAAARDCAAVAACFGGSP